MRALIVIAALCQLAGAVWISLSTDRGKTLARRTMLAFVLLNVLVAAILLASLFVGL
jgi:hypothetical protein